MASRGWLDAKPRSIRPCQETPRGSPPAQETVVPEAARNPLEQPNEGLEPTAYSFGSAALHLRFRRRLRPGVRLAGREGVVLLAPPQDHDKMSDQAEDWHERPTE
jgi:hypothetical protein